MLQDTYVLKGRRKALVDQLSLKGISDSRVLQAMMKVPRHFFLDSAFEQHAYLDKPFSIGEGQTISQPYTVAYQSELLNLQEGDKVLEIGTGSGYQATILHEMGAHVYTIEFNKNLYKRTKKLLKQLNYKNIHCFNGDGSMGLKEHAPYDKILVTAAAPIVPEPLKEQLNVGGHLVIPTGEGNVQKMVRVTKKEENCFDEEEFDHFSFVPLLGKHGWS